MLEKYPQQVRLVFKHYPLRNHQHAYKAALTAMAAESRGKFWSFHDRLFQNHNRLSDTVLMEIRRELDLLDPGFGDLMKNPQLPGIIQRDVAEGRKAGVRGTPTIFINGKRYNGPRSMEGFSQAIESELSP